MKEHPFEPLFLIELEKNTTSALTSVFNRKEEVVGKNNLGKERYQNAGFECSF